MAYERGLAAAQQQEWGLAIRHFSEAQRTPHSQYWPPLFFNLGVAHAKAGQELAAMAWLITYLAAAPGAQNAPAVRTEVARLDVAAERKIQSILREAAAIARKLPDELDSQIQLSSVATWHAQVGDINAALALDKETRGLSSDDPLLWVRYAERLAKEGNVREAERLMSEWADRVNTTGLAGPSRKLFVDLARQTLESAKEAAAKKEKESQESSLGRLASMAENVSGAKEVARLDSVLREIASRGGRVTFMLQLTATRLDDYLIEVRKELRRLLAR